MTQENELFVLDSASTLRVYTGDSPLFSKMSFRILPERVFAVLTNMLYFVLNYFG